MSNISRYTWFLAAVLAVFFAGGARAQWHSDSVTNTAVCTLAGSTHSVPQICTDESDGAVIVWQDNRNAGAVNVYAQRINALGYPMWTANGVRLCTPSGGNSSQQSPVIASDGSGGAYVVWLDSRNGGSDIYGQHILASGGLAGPAAGIAVGEASNNQTNPVICSDGVGGAFVAWEDYRSTKSGFSPDIYMNRLSGGSATMGSSGAIADTGHSSQRNPAICADGSGGCYIAWEDGSTIPYSIQANHFDANGNPYWGIKGYLVYEDICGSCYTADASHVSIQLDGKALMLAWQVSSVSGEGENVMAARIRCSTATDSTQVWGHGVDVTGEMPFDQTLPEIFSDDSAVSTGADYRGILVPFVYQQPGTQFGNVASMIRVIGDGGTQLPGGGYAYEIGQAGFQAVKVTDNSGTGTKNGILAVLGGIRAQRMDRTGKTYFGKSPTWGLAISGHSPTTTWTVSDACLAPRSDGGIAAWTDMRSGTAAIYCQLIRMDGSLWIPHDTLPPVVTVQSASGSFDGSECNTRCYNLLAADTGALKDGIDSVIPVKMNNMEFSTPPSFSADRSSASFTVCVIDSMFPGSSTISIVDSQSNVRDTTFAYCTIADNTPPKIAYNFVQSPNWVDIHLSDDGNWDRGLKSYTIDTLNVKVASSSGPITSGDSAYSLTASIIDSTLPAHFYIKAIDVAGHASQVDTFRYSPTSGVAESSNDPISISIFPNPTSGGTTLWLDGAPSADVTIMDVLGRTVEQFHFVGSYELQTSSLATGAYTVRAVVGDIVVYKRIVKE